MKSKNCFGKVGSQGEIRIPKDYLNALGLAPGKGVQLQLTDKRLLIKPLINDQAACSIVDQLYGALELDPKIAKEMGNDDFPNIPEDV